MLQLTVHALRIFRHPSPAAAHSPELSRELMKLRIHLRNKFQKQIAQWRREQGTRSDGDMRNIQELVCCAAPHGGGGGGRCTLGEDEDDPGLVACLAPPHS